MRHLAWVVILTPSLFLGATVVGAAVIGACNSKDTFPPIANNESEGGSLGGGGDRGGGGGTKTTACAKENGQCLLVGDMVGCPDPVVESSLCNDPINEAGTSGRFCCLGLNDAGAPDALLE
jgi:hypothetical protein